MPLQPESRVSALPVMVMALSQAAAGDAPGGQELSLTVLTWGFRFTPSGTVATTL